VREVKEVDIYVDGKRIIENLTLNYKAFDMKSNEPQSITATAFLPSEEYFSQRRSLVIDFKDGIFARANIYESLRLGDEYQSDMVIVDAGYSLEEMLSAE